MKFINYLKDIHNVQVYPMFTLILFIIIFILATILVFSKSRETITEIKNLPLEE
jgi:hypothetical protein